MTSKFTHTWALTNNLRQNNVNDSMKQTETSTQQDNDQEYQVLE